VIYTSGSTGKPKGVGVTHEALSNLLDSMQQVLALTDRDVWVAVTTLAFDIAALEIFLPLLAGAQVVVAPEGTTADGRALGDLLETAHATVMQATPSGWRLLLESGWRGSPALKSLCGGEALDEALANELLMRCGDVWNVYGPTETTIWSSTWRLPRPVGHILIGEPLARTDLHVLDAMGMPAPPGVAGELCIGGRGLARGYRGRPALTAEKFVPDPFAREPGARLYRTGDRARRQIDGGITVLGRTDHQVKIRGHRLELGEIDAVLSRHPLVARAAVVAQAYGPGDTRLVAYVQPRVPLDSSEGGPSIALSHNQLASHVRAALPAYAVPSRFVRVARMPLTPNGKIDRESLATTEQSDIVNDDTGASTPTQTQLAAIWTDVLGVSRVGIRTSFFEAGGNSLLAGKVVARIRDRARVDLPLIALFEHPTIESLAALLDRTIDGTADGRRYAPIVPVERSEAGLPLSFAQRRLWFLEQLAPGDPAYHMVAAFRVTGAIDVRALDETLGRVAARHEMLRTRFIAANGEPRQIVEPTSLLSLTVRDLTAWPAAARHAEGARIAEREAIEPFDLAHGPLLRVTLVRMAADDALLIFAMHHIAADGRSAVLLTREISALYAQAVANVPAALPALPIQYGDYAAWQAGAMSSDTAAAQLRYWSKQLAATAATPLFTRREVPETARDGAVVAIGIPADVLRGLETLAQREGTTLFTVLYTCLTLVLSIVTRHDDVPIGTDIGARDQLETEHVIGLFVNQLVLRTPIDNDGDYRAFLQRAWATVQGALANRDVPYERIVEELQPGRASGSGLFQAKLVLQEAEPAQLALAGATVTPVPVARGYAKFDLLVNLAQRDGALVGQIEFRPSVVTARQAEIIVEELRAGLAGIAADAGVTIDSLRRQLSAIGARRLADLEDATERAAIEHFHARAAARPRHRAH
jgi:non-ribosomal peptide synthetase component F